jgi:hypothetical protein
MGIVTINCDPWELLTQGALYHLKGAALTYATFSNENEPGFTQKA